VSELCCFGQLLLNRLPEETVRMHDYLLKGGFLWVDDNWDPDFDYIRPNLMRILPNAKIVDLPVDHPIKPEGRPCRCSPRRRRRAS
jgi:hypothetical protein